MHILPSGENDIKNSPERTSEPEQKTDEKGNGAAEKAENNGRREPNKRNEMRKGREASDGGYDAQLLRLMITQ